MITADKLRLLTNMPPVMLTMGIQQAGYKQDKFTSATFVGITNANEFCYSAGFIDSEGEFHDTKVFVKYDPTADQVSMDY